MATRIASAARQAAIISRISPQPSLAEAANLVPRRGLAGAADHHGSAKINCWQDPMSPSKLKEEHISIASIPVRISSILPLYPILSKSIGSFKSLATQSSCDEVEVTNKLLNRVVAAAQSSSPSNEEICACTDELCKAGNTAIMSNLLDSLHDKQIFLCVKAYNLLLAAASKGENNTELSLRIFKDLLLSSKSLGPTSYFNLARACAKASDSVLLLSFVGEVSALAFPRSVVVLNRIIFAFAECGLTDKALAIYNHMKRLECEPDLFTYNTVLGILGRAGQVDDMLLEFASMKENNLLPDIVSYNTLINYLQKLGRLHLCIVYFREMRDAGVHPDLRTYTSMIEGFGRSGDIEESLGLLDEMKHLQIQPSIYIYRSLVNNSRKMGKSQIAASLLNEMNSSICHLVGPKDFKRKTM
ncbi:hypothetical protein Dimus_009608 [Dionaea muscipula]